MNKSVRKLFAVKERGRGNEDRQAYIREIVPSLIQTSGWYEMEMCIACWHSDFKAE